MLTSSAASAAAAAAAAAMPLSASFTSASSTTASSCSSSSRHPTKEVMHTTPLLDLFFTDAQLAQSIDGLSVKQMVIYRKMSHLKLTSILEKHMQGMINIEEEAPGSPASRFHKLIKRFKTGDSKKEERGVFGAPLSEVRRRYGSCLPHSIMEIIRFLRLHAHDSVGIFRKNGVKSRITELKEIANMEKEGDVFVEDLALQTGQVHDIADLLKQYLRELPEPLMTASLSKAFATIFEHVPEEEERLTALRYAIALLPEDNREALQTLLIFFNEVASNQATNSMSADNISVCLTPSMFTLSASRLNAITPSRRHKTIGSTGMPTEAEMAETRAAQKCLSAMITNVMQLFVVTESVQDKGYVNERDAPPMRELNTGLGPKSYLICRINDLVKDRNDRWPSYIVDGVVDGVEMSSKKPADGHPLKHFRVWTDIEAPPREVLRKIKHHRALWDATFMCQRRMEAVASTDVEVMQYVINDTPGHATRDFCVVRMSNDDLYEIRNGCAYVERSVACSETQMMGGVQAAVLEMKWLIEPHEGRSRVTMVSRVDLRGRRTDWYNAQYGYSCARQLARLRDLHRPRTEDAGARETKI